MRQIKSLADVQMLARDVEDLRAKLETHNTNMRGRRITGAGRSKDLDDYVTRREVLGGIVSKSDIKAIKNLRDKTDSKIDPKPGDITISTGAITGQYYWDANDNTQKIKVTIPWTAPGTSDFRNFTLLKSAVERPFKDAANPLDPTDGYYVLHDMQTYEGVASGTGSTVFIINAPSRNEYWRFYFATGNETYQPAIIRTTGSLPTNNVVISIIASSTVLSSDYSGNIILQTVGGSNPSFHITDGTLTMDFDRTYGLQISNSAFSSFTQIFDGSIYIQDVYSSGINTVIDKLGISTYSAGFSFSLRTLDGFKMGTDVIVTLGGHVYGKTLNLLSGNGGLDTAGNITGISLKLGTFTSIDTAHNFYGNSLTVNGILVVDFATNIIGNSLKVNGTIVIDYARNIDCNTVKVNGTKVVDAQQAAIALPSYGITGTADLTYDAVERDMINAIKTDISTLGSKIDTIIATLRAHGLIAT